MTGKCLLYYCALMKDEAQLMTFFGKSPDEADKRYMRKSILRFKGDQVRACRQCQRAQMHNHPWTTARGT